MSGVALDLLNTVAIQIFTKSFTLFGSHVNHHANIQTSIARSKKRVETRVCWRRVYIFDVIDFQVSLIESKPNFCQD